MIRIKKVEYILMVLAIVFLVMCFCAMCLVANFQQGTIAKYGELCDQQREDYSALSEKYLQSQRDLRSVQHQLEGVLSEYEEYRAGAQVNLPTYTYTQEDIILLAKVAQTEMGTPKVSPTAFKWGVQVVLNRVASPFFPDTVHDVVYQTYKGVPQFSVTLNGVLDNCEPTQESIDAVYEVILFGCDLPDYVEYFYEEHVEGNWVNTLPVYKTVDGTTFAYSERSMNK